ncbi:MAG: SurA N-terminal domain-containing protein [Elusimicrobiota bacterium]
MLKFLNKYKKIIFIITGIGFMMGIFIGFGSYFFTKGWDADAIAMVDKTKISQDKFSRYYRNAQKNIREKGEDITEDADKRLQIEVLRELIQEEVLVQQAKKYGIFVSDAELARYIQSFDAFKRNGVFDRNTYIQVLSYERSTPIEFEEDRRRDIMRTKLVRILMQNTGPLTPAEISIALREKFGTKMPDQKEQEKFVNQLRQERMSAFFEDWYRQINKEVKVREFLSERLK